MTKDSNGAAYTVAGSDTIVQVVNDTYSRWKARLHPGAASDGSHTIKVAATAAVAAATLAATPPPATATIHDIVFGEVWLVPAPVFSAVNTYHLPLLPLSLSLSLSLSLALLSVSHARARTLTPPCFIAQVLLGTIKRMVADAL